MRFKNYPTEKNSTAKNRGYTGPRRGAPGHQLTLPLTFSKRSPFPFLVAVSIAASRFRFSLPLCGSKHLRGISLEDSSGIIRQAYRPPQSVTPLFEKRIAPQRYGFPARHPLITHHASLFTALLTAVTPLLPGC